MRGELIKCSSFAVFQWVGVEFNLIYRDELLRIAGDSGELREIDLKKFVFFSLFEAF